jgi:hypothetical protein
LIWQEAGLGASVALENAGKTSCPIHAHRGNICVLVDVETKQLIDTLQQNEKSNLEYFY